MKEVMTDEERTFFSEILDEGGRAAIQDFEATTNEERVFFSEILNAASLVLWHSGKKPTHVLVAPDRWPSTIMLGIIMVAGMRVERSRLVKPGSLACIRDAKLVKIFERVTEKGATVMTEEPVSKASEAERSEVERMEAAERERDALVAKLVEIFGWEDSSFLHAILHVENAIGALRSDCVVMAEREKRNESVLAERWRHLLLSESRFQYQRSLILDSTVRRALRSSAVNTAFVGALKEALRLTDVERLPIEDASGAAALRQVVNATIVKLQAEVERVGEEIDSTAGLHADNPTLESLSLLRHTIMHVLNDLEAARDNPLEYIATRTAIVGG